MVLAVAVLGMLVAAAYAVMQPTVYQAEANLTVPLPASSNAQADPGQYLDSQVLLLQSQGVAQRAVSIANSQLGSDSLNASNFSGSDSSLTVSPPATATPGGYGASIVAVSFTGSSTEIAEVGLNAALQAFDEANANAITQQANATVAGINKAISQTAGSGQRDALVAQETQTLINEQTDLARTPTAAFGPTTRANGHGLVDAVIGLVAGLVVGAALAYALAVRRRAIAGRQDASAIYGVPMIAETPAFQVTDGVQPMVSDHRSAVAEGFRFAAGSVERLCALRGMPLSLAFVSPRTGHGKSTVVASLALAMAERGTRLLVVDADTTDGGVTAQLLPGISVTQGFEQVLCGQLMLVDCVQPSPLNDALAVLGSVSATRRPLTSPARSGAARALLAEATRSFDIVIIDAPALLEVADAAELADAADAAIIVVSSDDRIPDHLQLVNWLKSTPSHVVGYVYNRAQMRPHGSRLRRDRSMGQPGWELGRLAPIWISRDESRQPSQPSQPPQR
jgi:Mrp family chromosome partitioning ATPase